MTKKWTPPPLPKSIIPDEAFDVGFPTTCGMIEFADDEIEINAGRPTLELVMINTGDRPVQIGAHYHIAECNRAMAFDRAAAVGYRLDIPSGTAVRFEPGQSRKVQLTTYTGRQVAYGMNNMTNGSVRSEQIREAAVRRLRENGYCFEGERYKVRQRPDALFGKADDSKK